MKSIAQLWERAERYLKDGQVLAARAVLESILVRDANQPRVHLVLGGVAWNGNGVRDATRHALAAARCQLTSPELVCDVIAALVQVGESALAHQLFDHPLLVQGELPVPILMRLSGQAQNNGEHVRALDFLERARRAGASGAEFQCYLGVQLAFNGRLEEAERELESCLQLDPAAGRASLILSRLHTQSDEHNHLQGLAAGLKRVRAGTDEHAALEFARYKELEDLGRYPQAWQALTSANRIMHECLRHDPDAEVRSFDRLIERTADWSPPLAASGGEGPQPIFILGMPRSGTTLLDRILGNHSWVANAGELDNFRAAVAMDPVNQIDFEELGRRYLGQTQWRAGNKAFYVDKFPANWIMAGLIARVLPQARILHLVRDPMDVCFSNYRALFGVAYPYSYDLACLASHYRGYRRVMAHWHRVCPGRIMDVAYRDLIDDAPGVTRRVFDFCGLPFESGCANVTRNRGAIATLSMAQAREPIHARALEQWRPYAEWLEPLRAALADL